MACGIDWIGYDYNSKNSNKKTLLEYHHSAAFT